MLALAASPSPYWFITRGTGTIALVLLTVSAALGVANVRRVRLENVPRFVLDSIHRSASLLAVAFTVVHIVTTLLDGFAPIGVIDAFIPLHSAYRPVWLGLGAVAFDLLIAVTLTSLLRQRLGYRAWRITHWTAYACWPVALVHGYGTGTDAKTHWMLVLTAGCILVILAAVVVRIRAGWPDHLPARLSALGACALLPIGLIAWLPSGPLGQRWAERSGTPAPVLAAAHAQTVGSGSTGRASAAASNGAPTGTSTRAAATTTSRFSASVHGSVHEGESPDGSALVDIRLTVSNPKVRNLEIRLRGQPVAGGGVQMSSSRVLLGTASNRGQYTGHVTALDGTDIQAAVSDSGGHGYSLATRLDVPQGGGPVSGTVTATPQG